MRCVFPLPEVAGEVDKGLGMVLGLQGEMSLDGLGVRLKLRLGLAVPVSISRSEGDVSCLT